MLVRVGGILLVLLVLLAGCADTAVHDVQVVESNGTISHRPDGSTVVQITGTVANLGNREEDFVFVTGTAYSGGGSYLGMKTVYFEDVRPGESHRFEILIRDETGMATQYRVEART